MVPKTDYIFLLTVSYEEADTDPIITTCEFLIRVNEPPSSGSFEISPAEGAAFMEEFEIIIFSWYD